MKELNSQQLLQVSGGVILGVSDVNTQVLVLSEGEVFFFTNFNTGDIYLFEHGGKVLFIEANGTSYPINFPYQIVRDELCEYTLPYSMFKI